MGGKKKPTLSQMAKKAEKEKGQPIQKAKKEVKKEEASKRTVQTLDEKVFQTIARDIQNMKAITPYEIAVKHGIKISTAFKVLRALRDRGDLILVAKGHRTEVYVKRS